MKKRRGEATARKRLRLPQNPTLNVLIPPLGESVTEGPGVIAFSETDGWLDGGAGGLVAERMGEGAGACLPFLVLPVLGLVFPLCFVGAGAGTVSDAAGGGEDSGAEAGGDEADGVATGGAEAAGGLAGARGTGGLLGASEGEAAGAFEGGALLGAFEGGDLLGAFAGELLLGGGALGGDAAEALEGGCSALGEDAAGGGDVVLEGLGLAAGVVDLVDAGVGAVANTTPLSPSTVFISEVAMQNHNIIHK